MQYWCILLLLAGELSLAHGQAEVLINPGFEDPLGSEWTCGGCTGSISTDAQSGSKSFKVAGRNATWQGPIQTLPLGTGVQPGVSYHFIGYVKVIQGFGENILATIAYKTPGDNFQYSTVASASNVNPSDGWILLDVDYTTLDIGQTEMRLYIEGPNAGVEFLVDSLSMKSNLVATTTPALPSTTPPTQNNILQNPGFEDSLSGYWSCSGDCTGSRVNDAHSGSKAYKASGRTATWQGPIQTLPLGTGVQSGTSYHFTGYVKVLNSMSESIQVTIVYTKPDNTNDYQAVAYLPNIGSSDGWVLMDADYTTLNIGQTSMKLYIEGPAAGVDFQVDSLSLSSNAAMTTSTTGSPLTTTSTTSGILQNPGFESSLSGNWFCNGGCTGTRVNDAHSGSKSYRASNRGNFWEGPRQTLPLGTKIFAGRYYYFSGHVKILQSVAGQASQRVSATVAYTLSDGSIDYVGIASALNLEPSDGWVNMTADFLVPNNGETGMDLYIEGPVGGIDFLVDSLELEEIPTDPQWRIAARDRIENIRKGTLNIEIKTKCTRKNLKLVITQDTHEFGFGTAVDGRILNENLKYRQWYLDNFEWAVLENDLKWRQTEFIQNVFTYGNAQTGLNILKSNSKKVRGHTIVWADEQSNPPWVQQITNPTVMYNKTMKRINDLLGNFSGCLYHWDVNNEMIPNSFYMDVYNSDPTIRYDMFREARRVDPSAKLFLNEYNVVSSGQWTDRYIKLAQEFQAAGAPVDGMGVQSHLSSTPSGAVLLNRLDRLSAVGLPIWVTELDYANSDVNIRAGVLEDALLAYFSHPNVYGVLFWGFWDERHWRGSNASLVDGPNLVENKAGEMWRRRFHVDWRSTETINLRKVKKNTGYQTSKQVFYGDYTVNVTTRSGRVLRTKQVTVSKSAGSATVNFRI